MKPRGSALAIAIVCVLLVAGVCTLLVRSGTARVQARRADVNREAALRRAEAALEVARAAVEAGSLKPGGEIQAEGLTVQCTARLEGCSLTVAAEAPVASGVSPSSLRRMLHVSWVLQRAGTQWRRTDWSTAYETETVRPLKTKAESKR